MAVIASLAIDGRLLTLVPGLASALARETVTGRQRIGWDQRADSSGELGQYQYVLYLDGSRKPLFDVACIPVAGPEGYPCTASLPPLTPGAHTLELVAWRDLYGEVWESPRSVPLSIIVGDMATKTGSGSAPQIFVADDGTRFTTEVVATALDAPAAMAFAPDGRLFVAELAGRVRVLANGQILERPALLLPDVAAGSGGGLFGIALHPLYSQNGLVYLVYLAESPTLGDVYRVVRYRAVNDVLAQRSVLLDDIPAGRDRAGATLRFGPDGKLFLTMGSADPERAVQDLASLSGKVLRLNDDATTPSDNPLPSRVFSYGHGSVRGLDWHPVSRQLWAVEHTSLHTDQLTVIQAGRDHGSTADLRGQPGVVAPALEIRPQLGVAGSAFYTSEQIRGFKHDLFVAALDGQHLLRVRLAASSGPIMGTERLLQGRFGRIRDVVMGPDGSLYFCTSNRDRHGRPVDSDDRIVRIVPVPEQPKR